MLSALFFGLVISLYWFSLLVPFSVSHSCFCYFLISLGILFYYSFTKIQFTYCTIDPCKVHITRGCYSFTELYGNRHDQF